MKQKEIGQNPLLKGESEKVGIDMKKTKNLKHITKMKMMNE